MFENSENDGSNSGQKQKSIPYEATPLKSHENTEVKTLDPKNSFQDEIQSKFKSENKPNRNDKQPKFNPIDWINKIDNSYTELWKNSKQQVVPRSKRFHLLFTATLSIPICVLMGIILILLGVYIYFHNLYIQEVTISYSESDENRPISFQLPNRIEPPIYLYYELKNFYGNTRLYVRDAPGFIYVETTCTYIKTNKQAIDFRTINGALTLPELKTNILTNETIQSNDQPTYPCGLASASLFNDRPQIISPDQTNIPIEITDFENDWDLIQFLQKTSSIKVDPWYLTYKKDYRIWLHPPFTSNFRKPFGTINTALEPGQYSLVLLENVWPSTQWNVEKSFTLTTLSIAGGKNRFLLYSLFAAGSGYIFFAILLFILHTTRYIFIDKTYKIVDLPELKI